MIKANEGQFPVELMCRMLAVSRSGYYDWKHRPLSDRGEANKLLANDIKHILRMRRAVLAHPESLGDYKKKENQQADTG